MSHKLRIVLIHVGKIVPFLICFLVLISYSEDLFAMTRDDYVSFHCYVIPNKPISWFIGSYFEYNMQTLVIITIISYAIQACKWNKLAIAHLAFQLYEKDYFNTHIYENNVYYFVIAINIAIALFFVYMGGRLLFNK